MSDEKNDKWEMPQPVFRSSTGSLPRSLEETISQSFQPNAKTIEIDEDDDILSIMDTPYRPNAPSFEEHPDPEETLKIDRDILEVPREAKVEEPEQNPIVVTAKKPNEKAADSGLFVFILVVLIVVAIATVIVFNFSKPATTQ